MQPNLVRKLKTLLFICLCTAFAGVIYQLIDDHYLDYNSVLVGLPLGLVFGMLELFLFPKTEKRFRRWPFTKMLAFKVLLYTSVIYVVTGCIATIKGLSEGREISELLTYLKSPQHLILILYTLVVYSLLVFFLQVNHFVGRRYPMEIHSG